MPKPKGYGLASGGRKLVSGMEATSPRPAGTSDPKDNPYQGYYYGNGQWGR